MPNRWTAAYLHGGPIEGLREEVGIFLPVAEYTRYERAIAHARVWIRFAEWTAAWAERRAMTLEQVVAFALSLPGVET